MTARKPFYKSTPFLLAVGIAFSALCMWLAVRKIINEPGALAQIGQAFRQANYWTLPLILIDLALFYWLKAWRWRLLLAPVGNFRPVRDLLPSIMSGFALNNVLPARMGELVRCLSFSKVQKVPLTAAFSSVVLERILDALAVVTYLGIGLLMVQGVDPAIQTSAYVVAVMALSLVVCGTVYVVWTKPFVRFVEWILEKIPVLPSGIRKKIAGILEGGAKGLASLKDVRLLIGIVVITLVKWGLNGLLVLFALWTFGIQVPNMLAVCCVTMGAVAFFVAAPSVPGYFGVIQLAFMSVFKLFPAIPEQTVFAASIYYHLSQYVPVTIIGLIMFAGMGLTLRQVEQVREERNDPTPPPIEAEPTASRANIAQTAAKI